MGKLVGVDLGRVTLVQEHELGMYGEGSDGRGYRYSKAGAAIALGDALKTDTAEGINDVDPVSAADQVVVGCWPNESVGGHSARAAIADNSFFWMLVNGDGLTKAATVVAGTPAISVATAGTLDDTAATAANALATAAGCGCVFLTADSGGFARVRYNG